MIYLLNEIINITKLAGVEVLKVYSNNTISTSIKNDHTPITNADIISHKLIVNRIKKITPNIPIVSEESYSDNSSKEEDIYWLVDPIDGTEGFIKRNDHYTINIALIIENIPTLGVVYAPSLNELFFAKKNYGAFKVKNNVFKRLINDNIQQPTTWKVLSSKINSVEYDNLEKQLSNLGNYQISKLSSSIKICRIAEGSYHLYIRLHPTSQWDIAAAHCIASEANTSIVQPNGNGIQYSLTKSILNPKFIVVSNKLKETALKCFLKRDYI